MRRFVGLLLTAVSLLTVGLASEASAAAIPEQATVTSSSTEFRPIAPQIAYVGSDFNACADLLSSMPRQRTDGGQIQVLFPDTTLAIADINNNPFPVADGVAAPGGGYSLTSWRPFAENPDKVHNVSGYGSVSNVELLEIKLAEGNSLYCPGSLGTYVSENIWQQQYWDNSSYSADETNYYGPAYGATLYGSVPFSSINTNTQVFVPGKSLAHVNRFYVAFPWSTSGYLPASSNYATPYIQGSWSSPTAVFETCRYVHDGACPHNFFDDRRNGSCDNSTSSVNWYGCTLEMGSLSKDASEPLCTPSMMTRTQNVLRARGELDAINAAASAAGYSDIWTTDRPCVVIDTNARAMGNEYLLLHRDEYQYRQLKWYTCESVPSVYHTDPVFTGNCATPVPVIEVTCAPYGASGYYGGHASFTADIAPSTAGVWGVSSPYGTNASGPYSNNSSATQNQRFPSEPAFVSGDNFSASIQMTSPTTAPETVVTSGIPSCDGDATPPLSAASVECTSPTTANVTFRAISSSFAEVPYTFGTTTDVAKFASGTLTQSSGIITGTYSATLNGTTTFRAEVAGHVSTSSISPSDCQPTAVIECAFAPAANNFQWRATLNGARFPTTVNVYDGNTRVARDVRIDANSTGTEVSGTTTTGRSIEVRYASSGAVLAELTISLGNCSQNANAILACGADGSVIPRVDNISFSNGDKIFYRLFLNEALHSSGEVLNSTLLPSLEDLPTGTLVELVVYGRRGLDDLNASPETYTEVIDRAALVTPCGAIEAAITDYLDTSACPNGGPEWTRIVLASNGTATQFTLEATLLEGATRTATRTVDNDTLSTNARAVFNLSDAEYALLVDISVSWSQGPWDLETSEQIRHGAVTDCVPSPCDADFDGTPDMFCDNRDVIADIIHDSWEYASVRDITDAESTAHTYCGNTVVYRETCNVRFTGSFSGWRALFGRAEILSATIDISQEERAIELYPVQTSGIDYELCDPDNLGLSQRLSACEVIVSEKATVNQYLNRAAAETGTYSEWIFNNGTLAGEIVIDGQPVTSGLCWDVAAEIVVSLRGPGGSVFQTFVDADVVYNAHPEIGMPYGPFWQPTGSAPHSTGCFAVWLPTPSVADRSR